MSLRLTRADKFALARRICLSDVRFSLGFTEKTFKVARLDFLGGYLPSLSINYVGMSKDIEKRLPQLYYIKMKISYDLGFIAIGVAMAM